MPDDVEQLARIQQAHHRRLLGVQGATANLVGEAWDTFADLDDLAASEFTAAAEVIVDAGTRQTSTLAVAYMNANDRVAGFPGADLIPVAPTIRGGTPTAEVYHRSIVQARTMVSRGAAPADALAAGRARAVATAETDINLANKAEIERGGALRPWVVGYRRILTGKSCAFCATASTQRYRSARLMPIHTRCDCDVGEIYGTADPGRVINQQLLDDLKDAAKKDGAPRYWEGPYVVDEDGTISYKKVETLRDDDGRKLLGPDGKPMRRTTAGDPIKVRTVDHGEVGPMLADGKHATATVRQLEPKARRTKATVDDPDVIREAQRRNVSRDRVIELREEKAERRHLEDRARREAEKRLSVDDPVVQNAARRFGVSPDEILSARHRVADVRKAAREEAARIQMDALAELDRLDVLRLRPPPRKGARTGMGAQARGGEYDWLEALDERELGRLSRRWYDANGQTPDQIALQMNARGLGGGDLSDGEAMEIWLRLTRTEEAAGAIRRGKLPSERAYSGQVDPTRLLPDLEREGYDVEILFGDDINAAGHIAEVDHRLVADEALEYLGDAARAAPGSRPYEMSFQAWEVEVRTIEEAFRENAATLAERRRYAELVPQYIDEPGVGFEELYARIVSTARKAGEEVPDHARIPWQ